MNSNDLAKEFLTLANKYVGVSEEPFGSNRGDLIDKWNRQSNVPLGSFWCCSFVSAIGKEFQDAHNIDWPVPITADCDVVYSWARKRQLMTSSPAAGDLFVCHRGDDAYHIGIVDTEGVDGIIGSIEGNSNNNGSRNGYLVARRPNVYANRTADSLKFIRWTKMIQQDEEWVLKVKNRQVECINHASRVYAPLRNALNMFFTPHEVLVNLKATDDGAMWGSEIIPAPLITRDGKRYIGVRDLALWLGSYITINDVNKTVTLSKP
jgi:hypothetical protein